MASWDTSSVTGEVFMLSLILWVCPRSCLFTPALCGTLKQKLSVLLFVKNPQEKTYYSSPWPICISKKATPFFIFKEVVI